MNDILKSLFGDEEGVLSESSQATLTEAINKKVDEMVTEKVDLALESQDKQHTGMLQTLVEKYEEQKKQDRIDLEEKIDQDHSDTVLETFNKVDADQAQKMVQVKEHYEGLLNTSVKDQTDLVVKGLDTYLENWLDEHVPTDVIQEAAKKDYSQELLVKISNLVGINEQVTDDVREGIQEAHDTIEEQTKIIEKLNKDKFIAEAVETLPVLEKQFLTEQFKEDKYSLDFVKRNFDYARKLYSKNEEAPARVVSEKSTSAKNVDRQQVLVENKKVTGDEKEALHPAMAGWVKSAQGRNVYGENK